MKHFILIALIVVSRMACAEVNISPNMNLPIPQVGVTPGPAWATDINNSLTLIDGHNHTPGFGVQVPSNGLNINANLSFNNFAATALSASIYTPQGSCAINDSLCVNGVDLYYTDGNGVTVRLTQGGAIVGPPGTITGLAPPASASYSFGNNFFTWQQDVNTAAGMDFGPMRLRNISPGSHFIEIDAPSVLSADYAMTLPGSLPGSTLPLTLDSSGNIAAGTALVPGGGTGDTTLTQHGVLVGNGTSAVHVTAAGGNNTVLIGSSGSDPTFSATPTVTSVGIGTGPVLTEDGTSSGLVLAAGYLWINATSGAYFYNGNDANTSFIGLAGTFPASIGGTGNTFPIVVSQSSGGSQNGMMIVRGGGSTTPSSTSCGTAIGEGYTCTRTGAGVYSVSFSIAFQSLPACTCTGDAAQAQVCSYSSPTSAGIIFNFETTAPLAADTLWSFICIGERNSSH